MPSLSLTSFQVATFDRRAAGARAVDRAMRKENRPYTWPSSGTASAPEITARMTPDSSTLAQRRAL